MSNFSESFQRAHEAHINWQKDRPLIDKFNHSDIQVAIQLLYGEIEELNGGDDTGVFNHDNIKDAAIRTDYRQQEISDIIVFAVTAYDKLGVNVDHGEIEARVRVLASNHDFSMISSQDSKFPPAALANKHEVTYEMLKKGLNQEAAKIAAFDVETGNREDLVKALEGILVHCVAMHSLLGVNSGKAVMEKIARNMIKYPAFMFQMTEEELLMDDVDLKELYDTRRAECATDFDGPKMNIEVTDDSQPSGKRTVYDRPKTGTTDFYTMPELIENYQPGEQRRIGIWYRAAAQIIASSYGFSVRVSNLLNRNKENVQRR